MLTHSTLPRGGVVHAMSLCEALTALGVETVLHAPDAEGRGFFRKAPCAATAFPVEPAPRDIAEMVEQRIDDYVDWFRRPENRDFDLYHAHDAIGGNALATLKEEGVIPAFVRTVHHIDDFADPRLDAWQTRSIRAADALMVVSDLWRESLIARFGREAESGGNGVDACRYSPHADGSEAELRRVWVSATARLSLGRRPRSAQEHDPHAAGVCRDGRANPDRAARHRGRRKPARSSRLSGCFRPRTAELGEEPRRFRCSAPSTTPRCRRSTASPRR